MAEIVRRLTTAVLEAQRRPDMGRRRPRRRLVMFRARSRASRERVSDKIRHLISEGTPRRQAVAMALNMERAGRLRAGGRYVRKGER